MLSRQEYEDRLRSVRLLITDVDGVLTDGSVVYLGGDAEAKAFHVRDGSAVYIARLIELPVAVVTGRTSDAVARRFSELPVLELHQGQFDKLSICLRLERRLGIEPHEVAFVGDDLVDLPTMRHVGVGVCVADAHPRLLAEADWRTERVGGRGAFREIVDDVVTARGAWDRVMRDYEERQGGGAPPPPRD